MSKVLDDIKKRASLLGKHIVLPEGEDKRVVQAAADSVKEGIAKITLLGSEEEIRTGYKDDGWQDYTGPILVKLSDVENIYIR